MIDSLAWLRCLDVLKKKLDFEKKKGILHETLGWSNVQIPADIIVENIFTINQTVKFASNTSTRLVQRPKPSADAH